MQGIDLVGFIQRLPIYLIPLIFAITVHEVAHGWVARHRGDPTAMMLGRLTLNPAKHIDPMGTFLVPLVMLLLSGGRMAIGWAKPVPVAFRNLRNPRTDMILVAAAGPITNLLMALGWSLLIALQLSFVGYNSGPGQWFLQMFVFGIRINVLLAVFNLIPIPPLDGGRVLAGLLPPGPARALDNIEPYGFLIVIGLWAVNILPVIIEPFFLFFNDFFWSVAGLG
jgi:Zn-dependent protease